MQVISQPGQRWTIGEPLKRELNAACFLAVANQSLVFRPIAIGPLAAVPKSCLSPLMHLVSGSIRRHFAFELRKVAAGRRYV